MSGVTLTRSHTQVRFFPSQRLRGGVLAVICLDDNGPTVETSHRHVQGFCVHDLLALEKEVVTGISPRKFLPGVVLRLICGFVVPLHENVSRCVVLPW
jgi:hypothetical protein